MTDSNPRILIIDEKPELCQLLTGALKDSHVTINSASTQTEAMRIASENKPDILITELSAEDQSGLAVIQSLADIPAFLIAGNDEFSILPEFAYRRSVKMFPKPLNIDRLKETLSNELRRLHKRNHASANHIPHEMQDWSAKLGDDYRKLSKQFYNQQALLRYHATMISAKTDDDVFRSFFQTFVRESGQILGCALVCNAKAELKVTGRFGVPTPDNLTFCQRLSEPLIDILLCNPVVQKIDAMDELHCFDVSIQRYIPGITIIAIPLIPAPGEMIGMIILYRKGEQPFSLEDESLAQMLAFPTALAVRRND